MHPKRAPLLKRILYIEDDNDTRELVSHMPAGSNYEVITSGTCDDALRIAKESHFNLYIIDNMLPEAGIGLCKQIRVLHPKTPILFCSGFTDDVHQKAAVDYMEFQFGISKSQTLKTVSAQSFGSER